MMKTQNYLFLSLLILSVYGTSSFAAPTPKKKYSLDDINVLIEVSIVGQPMPKQIMQRRKIPKNTVGSVWAYIRPDVPVPIRAGTSFQLKVNLVKGSGNRVDITNSPYTKYSVSSTHSVELTNGGKVSVHSVAPEGMVSTAHLGISSIWVEYVTTDGMIGFNGFDIDVKAAGSSELVVPPVTHAPSVTADQRLANKELLPNAWQELKSLQGIEVKTKPSDLVQLIILFDPNCPICAELWQRLYGKDSKHKVITSLWVPVAYMQKSSMEKAGHLLDLHSRQALSKNFDEFEKKTQHSNTPADSVTPQMRRGIERNSAYWRKLFEATPLIVYRTPDQKAYLQIGLPPQDQFETLLKQLPPSKLDSFGK